MISWFIVDISVKSLRTFSSTIEMLKNISKFEIPKKKVKAENSKKVEFCRNFWNLIQVFRHEVNHSFSMKNSYHSFEILLNPIWKNANFNTQENRKKNKNVKFRPALAKFQKTHYSQLPNSTHNRYFTFQHSNASNNSTISQVRIQFSIRIHIYSEYKQPQRGKGEESMGIAYQCTEVIFISTFKLVSVVFNLCSLLDWTITRGFYNTRSLQHCD